MPSPAHLTIIEKIPEYAYGTPKRSLRLIKEILTEFEYDDDFIEAVDDRFCQGFGAARDVIIEMLKRQYWAAQERAANDNNEQKGGPEEHEEKTD